MSTINRPLRLFTLLVLTAALGACKLIHIMPPGGEMRYIVPFSGDAVRCDAASICTTDIAYPSFYEYQVAVPHAGWELAGWRDIEGYLFWCGPGKATSMYRVPGLEACEVNNTGFAGNPGATAAIASDNLKVYISPIFVQSTSGIPYTNTVTVAGREWAQPADFIGLSWDGINSVCPGGACGPGAFLRGYDMSGWTWASLDDVNALANHYLAGGYTMGPGPDSFSDALYAVTDMLGGTQTSGPWSTTPNFSLSCSHCSTKALVGLTATENAADTTRAHRGRFAWSGSPFGSFVGIISTTGTAAKDDNDLEHGAFFYRLP